MAVKTNVEAPAGGPRVGLPPGPAAAYTARVDSPPGMIGSSPRRKEDRRLLVGEGRYLDDLTRDGQLHLGVVRSPHAHARVVSVDLAAARRAPGVIAAWSAADLPEA